MALIKLFLESWRNACKWAPEVQVYHPQHCLLLWPLVLDSVKFTVLLEWLCCCTGSREPMLVLKMYSNTWFTFWPSTLDVSKQASCCELLGLSSWAKRSASSRATSRGCVPRRSALVPTTTHTQFGSALSSNGTNRALLKENRFNVILNCYKYCAI